MPWRWAWTALAAVLLATPALATPTVQPRLGWDDGSAPSEEGALLLDVPTPIGDLDYRAGRGLRVGNSGLTIGGFATAVGEILEGGKRDGGIDSLNFLISYRPLSFVHLFSEVELTQPLFVERGKEGLRAEAETSVDRLYADFGSSDAINLRVGQFFTPIGRWNLAPADPLVWTTSEPLLVEEVFDDSVKGAMVWGSLFPREQELSYSLYGTFFNPITPDPDALEPRHVAGAHFAWTGTGSGSPAVGISYSASQKHGGEPWRSLVGVDAEWQPHERVGLLAEALFGEGPRTDGAVQAFFIQSVVRTVPTLYAVARYERFDSTRDRAVDLFDIGLAWVPAPYLRFKADYEFADHVDDRSPPGFRFSFSILF